MIAALLRVILKEAGFWPPPPIGTDPDDFHDFITTWYHHIDNT